MANNKSFTLEMPKKSEGWAKIQEWNKKWNRILAGVFCILAFLLSFAVVLFNIMNSVYDEPEHVTTELFTPTETILSTTDVIQNNHRLPDRDNCVFYEFYNITCSYGSGDSYNEELKHIIQETRISATNFTIMEWNFKDGLLTENWLDLQEITILSLSFVKVNIKDIEEGAFSSEIFRKTEKVTFMDFEISYFKKGMFLGLNSVTEFSLRNFPFKESEENLLEPMMYTLSSLQIQDVKGKLDLINITGDGCSNYFEYLEIVDLSSNVFEDTLSQNSFTALTSVISLFLGSAGLTSLKQYTFVPMRKSLLQLDLRNNNLKTLPDGIFDYLSHSTIFYLEGNNWNCNCSLVHINSFRERIQDFPKCVSPPELILKSIYNNVDECITTTPATITTTTTVAPTITTISSGEDSSQSTDIGSSVTSDKTTTIPPSTEIPSKNLVGISCNSTPPPELFRLSSEIFYITKHDQLFQISHISDGKVSVDVDPNCMDMVLLWFTFAPIADNGYIKPSDDFDCLSNLRQSFSISNLSKNTSYTFCLVRNNETKVSPFNCLGFYTPIEYIENVWLSKDHKTLTLCIIFCVSFFCLMLGAFCTYLCLRRKLSQTLSAELLKDPVIVPVEYGISPSYFSPTNYEPSLNITRPSFNRSISESSIESHRSYISAVTPSPFQIISWRMDKNKNKNVENVYMEKLPDIPPPLPPHPKRKSEVSENSTTKFYPSGISYA